MPLRVGFTFNQQRIHPEVTGEHDVEAEYDAPETLDAIRQAIESHGHEVIELEATPDLPARLVASRPDVVFNIAEGRGGRGREAHVPALLELLGIPYTGSDAVALGMTLDKMLAKRLAAAEGVSTPGATVLENGDEPLADDLRFPLIVKPLREGSSMGVTRRSVVAGETELRASTRALIEKYRQPVLVEEYVAGREVTVGLIGNPQVRMLPPLEVVFLSDDPLHVYGFEMKQGPTEDVHLEVPAQLGPKEVQSLEDAAIACFRAFGCRDFARLDFRLGGDGRPQFIECNPLPGLMPSWSDFCLMAEAAGIDHPALIGEILSFAILRLETGA
jgi:D-alanine-D-alanine ligase